MKKLPPGLRLSVECLQSCLRDLERSGKSCPYLIEEAEAHALAIYRHVAAMRSFEGLTNSRPAICDEAADTVQG